MSNNQIPTDWFTMELAGEDADLMIEVVNQGIDSRLEGFTKSIFQWHVHTTGKNAIPLEEWNKNGGEKRYGMAFTTKLHCAIHPNEMQILIRRLVEIGEAEWTLPDVHDGDMYELAGELADQIVEIHYGVSMGYGIAEEA